MNTLALQGDAVSDQEVWRAVASHEGAYEVSSHGRVRSVDRWIDRHRCRQFKAGVLLACPSDSGGYPFVHLGKRPQRRVRVHTLVLEAFVGPRPRGMEALHRDDCKANNHLGNLRWGTHSDNGHDAVRNGRRTYGDQQQ